MKLSSVQVETQILEGGLELFVLPQKLEIGLFPELLRLLVVLELLQRVKYDANVALEVAHHIRHLLLIAQYLNALIVWIVADRERPLDCQRKRSYLSND